MRLGSAAHTLVFVPVVFLACAGAPDDSARAVAVADAYVHMYFEQFPDVGTVQGYPDADDARLPDLSRPALVRWEALEDSLRAALVDIDAARITNRSAYLAYRFVLEQLESSIGVRACRFELWTVSPTFNGWQARYALLAGVQPVGTDAARAAAVARAAELASFLARETANLREGLRLGYAAPRSNVDRVLEQMDALLAAPETDSPFFDPARRDSILGFRLQLARVLADSVRPAIRRYRDFLEREYAPAARDALGVSANPNGAACYRAAIRASTSIHMEPADVRDLGLREMARYDSSMLTIAQRRFHTDDVPALLGKLRSDTHYTFATRAEMLGLAQESMAEAMQLVPDWFGIQPAAAVVIVPYPPFEERFAPIGQYSPASDDGTRPAVYLINTGSPREFSQPLLHSSVFHETYPGHHVQIAIAREREAVHPITRYFPTPALVEGWAFYAERLAGEMGLHHTAADSLGLLSQEAHRAARLVVDTGLHEFGWTREQGIAYILEHTARSPAQAAAEVDRFVGAPGQATAYAIVDREIRRLRAQAQEALADGFDIRDFHDRVLGDGVITLPLLRENIERWIAARDTLAR